jgi:hypothetical protein
MNSVDVVPPPPPVDDVVPSSSSSPGPPPGRPLCRTTVRNSVMSKRASLTVHEQSFVDHILQHGDETELVLLQENLNDASVFFSAGDRRTAEADVRDDVPPDLPAPAGPGSTTKRLEVLEARKNCRKSVELWKTTSLKAVAVNRLVSSSSGGGGGSLPTPERTKVITAGVPSVPPRAAIQQQAIEEKDEEAEEEEDDDDDDDVDGPQNDATQPHDKDASELRAAPGTVALEDEKKTEDDVDVGYANNDDVEDFDDDDDDDDDDDYDDEYVDEYDDEDDSAILPERLGKKGGPREEIRMASICLYNGQGFEVDDVQIFTKYSQEEEHYDPWIYTETDEEGHKFDFHILGTSHDDPAAQPHVLTPVLMHSLQPHLPDSKRGESFWLKYSLVRDGAAVFTFLQHLRGTRYSLMAMETVDGEVFGAFVGHPWTIQPSYFGTPESFVWRMRHSRTAGDQDHHHVPGDSLREQAQKEADIEVFSSQHLISNNDFFQLCQEGRIAVGGGAGSTEQDFGEGVGTFTPQQLGFALTLGEDGYLMRGSSSACLTFHSPPLSKAHADGSKFELVNLEVWGLTPCITELEARMMEMQHLFLKRNATL